MSTATITSKGEIEVPPCISSAKGYVSCYQFSLLLLTDVGADPIFSTFMAQYRTANGCVVSVKQSAR